LSMKLFKSWRMRMKKTRKRALPKKGKLITCIRKPKKMKQKAKRSQQMQSLKFKKPNNSRRRQKKIKLLRRRSRRKAS